MATTDLRHLSTPRLVRKAIGAKLKAFSASWFLPRMPGSWPSLFVGGRTEINYAAAVGDGLPGAADLVAGGGRAAAGRGRALGGPRRGRPGP